MPSPIPRAFWPYTVVAGANDLLSIATSTSPSVDLAVAPGTYPTIEDLLAAVVAALNAAAGSWSASVNSIGRVSLTNTGAYAALIASFNAGDPRRARSLHRDLGFLDNTTAYYPQPTITAQAQHAHGWYGVDPVTGDTGDLLQAERSQIRSLSGARMATLTSSRRWTRKISLGFLPPWKLYRGAEAPGHARESLERLIDEGVARVRWWPDGSDALTFADYAVDAPTHKAMTYARLAPAVALHSFDLSLIRLDALGDNDALFQIGAPEAPAITWPPNDGYSILANTVSGRAQPFVQVECFVDGVSIGSTAVRSDGMWYSARQVSAVGPHVVTAQAYAPNTSGTTRNLRSPMSAPRLLAIVSG